MLIKSISIKEGLTEQHQYALIKSISDPMSMTLEERKLLFEAIEILRSSQVHLNNQNISFTIFFNKFIDCIYTKKFIKIVIDSEDIHTTGRNLKKKILAEIRAKFTAEKWYRNDLPASRFLILFCLYWWNAIAIGYIFEIEVFHDLHHSGIKFKLHDLLKESERYSFADLTISEMNGDIKSSTYFLTLVQSSKLVHDFYITRYYNKAGAKYHWFVISKSEHWQKVNGEADLIIFPNWPTNFFKPMKFQFKNTWWYAISYDGWKNKILNYQQRSSQDEA
jgi:hypothetical protein